MKSAITLVLGICLTSLAHATGRATGNGGYVVKCTQGENSEYRLLDFYEVEPLSAFGLTLDRSISSSDYQSTLMNMIDKIGTLDSRRAELYRERATEVIASLNNPRNLLANFRDFSLGDSQDHAGLGLEANCEALQAVIQIANPMLTETKFTFQSLIFGKLSPFDQAGLILHELIYEEYLDYNADRVEAHSRPVRQLNALINSTEFEQLYFQVQAQTPLLTLATQEIYLNPPEGIVFNARNFYELDLNDEYIRSNIIFLEGSSERREKHFYRYQYNRGRNYRNLVRPIASPNVSRSYGLEIGSCSAGIRIWARERELYGIGGNPVLYFQTGEITHQLAILSKRFRRRFISRQMNSGDGDFIRASNRNLPTSLEALNWLSRHITGKANAGKCTENLSGESEST